jgi:SAM-dependent methyltransferase
MGTVLPLPANAVYNDPKTGTMLPDEGEIASAIPTDWNGVESPLSGDDKSLLSRLDKNPDSLFYADPRFVEHIDENAVKLMTNFVSNRAVKNGDSVLDLCSSWTSHLGDSQAQLRRVAGLGMNEKELTSNPSLTEWAVRDLNENPKLPYDDASFSVVLCQLSIDYLTRPLEVMKEVGRVLQPGGKVYILFSNRLFIQKAVALWTGADDIDHAFTVGGYLHFSDGGFEDIKAEDLSSRKGKKIAGDPLYVVSGVKA